MIQSYGKFVQVFRDKGLEVTEVKPGSDIWKLWQVKLKPLAERDRKRYPAPLIKLLNEAK
jgi:hypothetical protein